MASNTRTQLENWLKNIDVFGKVIDIGGIDFPIKGRTKSWDVNEYRILDIQHSDYVQDLNYPFKIDKKFDIAFCLEVLEYVFNPVIAIRNIYDLLENDGTFYLSTHFLFPHHGGGSDKLRFTRDGIIKILTEVGFKDIEIIPRMARDIDKFNQIMRSEASIYKHRGEIGHLIKCKKSFQNYQVTKTQTDNFEIDLSQEQISALN